MHVDTQELETLFRGQTDAELCRALYRIPCELSEVAIVVAQAEFNRRRQTAARFIQEEADDKAVQTKEATRLGWGMRLCAFCLSPVCFFIPTMLAWRRYYEHSEKQKAADWARWSCYGAAFYFALALVVR